ncbi:cell elongation protein 1 [Candida albicans Ca529L]|nr:cell elongation protein 1 [Candida albicans Ca529L]
MKFSKIACATVFALSSQAAIIHHAPEFNMKRDVVPAGQGDPASGPEPQLAPAPQGINTDLAKRSFLSIITALLGNIPQIIQIIMGIVKAFRGNKREDIDSVVAGIIADMPFVARAVDTAMTSVASTKRDGANDDVANAVVRLPEIVARVATGVQQSIENAKRDGVPDVGLNLVANAPRLISDVFDGVSETVQQAKRDGLEDALNELLEQLPKLITRSAESALKDSQPVKRDAGSVALSNLIKKSIETVGIENAAQIVSERDISSLIEEYFGNA